MNLNNLLEKLTQEHKRTLEAAMQRFPEFSTALNEHLELVRTTRTVVSPYETNNSGTFESTFKEVQGLSNAYGRLVSFVLSEDVSPTGSGYLYFDGGVTPVWTDYSDTSPKGVL